MKTTDRDRLEQLIDRYSIGEVLAAFAAICEERGDRIRASWDSATLGSLEDAVNWEDAGRRLQAIAESVSV